jgi:hypothetical protein
MRTRSFAALASILVVLGLLAPTAQAGSPLDWSSTPSEGPPGTVITITGVCSDDVNEWEAVELALRPLGGDSAGEPLVAEGMTITRGVEWTATLTVPDGLEPGTYEITKQCVRLDESGAFAGGEATTRTNFEVLPADEEPTTTTEVEPDPGDPEVDVPVPTAGPAEAVPATATYTG